MDDKKEETPVLSLRVHRDSKGEIRTISGITPNFAIPIEVHPLTYGASLQYKSFGMALFDWSVEDKIALLNNQIEEAYGQPLHIEDEEDLLNNFEAWTIDDLLMGVYTFSGMGRLHTDDEGNEEGEPQETNT